MDTAAPDGGQPCTLIIEFDRVLIDSEYALYRLWRDEFHRRGLLLTTETWASYRTTSVPAGSDAATEIAREPLSERLGLPITDLDHLVQHIASQYRAGLPSLPARPGIAEWLYEARHTGWRCILQVTNTDVDIPGIVSALCLSDLLDTALRTSPEYPTLTATAPGLDQQVPNSLAAGHTVVATGSPARIARAQATGYTCLAIPDKLNTHLLRPGPGVVVVDPELISFSRAVALAASSTTTPRPRTRHRPDRIDRIKGSLAGLALGDALGKLVGYRTADQLDTETTQVLDALRDGREPPAVFTGRVTDDTVMTLALADTIIANGHVSRDAFQTCLTTINPQGGWQVFKLKNSQDQVIVARDGHTNGCVPRSAVLAYLHSPDTVGDLIYDVLKISTLTHADSVALAVAMVFAVAITHAIDGYSPHETFTAIESLYESINRTVDDQDACASIRHYARTRVTFDTPVAYIDYLEDAVGIEATARSSAVAGLCLGLTGWPANQILPLLLRRSARGDLDSIAAIFSALAGAFHPTDIPTEWTSQIDRYCGRALSDLASQLHEGRDASSRGLTRTPPLAEL